MNIIEIIKKLFVNKKSKVLTLPKGNAKQYDAEGTQVLTPDEALEKNLELGGKELVFENNENKYKTATFNLLDGLIYSGRFEYGNSLEEYCIKLDQSKYITNIMEAYLKAKMQANKLDYASISINAEEISLFINCIQELEESHETTNRELIPAEEEKFKLLTDQQKYNLSLLSRNTREVLLQKISDNPSYGITMLNAVTNFMQDTSNRNAEFKFDAYKEFFDTEQGKEYLGLYTEYRKTEFERYVTVGQKEAFRLLILKTTDPNAELPEGLKEIYGNVENYMEESFIGIYKPLMILIDKIGATDVQKSILKDVVDKIIADKKQVVLYDNPENENCVSYKTIEEKVGLKFSPEAILLLSSVCNTCVHNKVEESHSIIISTHETSVSFYVKAKDENGKIFHRYINEQEARELYNTGEMVYISCMGDSEQWEPGKNDNKKCYNRYNNGKFVPVQTPQLEGYINKYRELIKERTDGVCINEDIRTSEELMNVIDEMEYSKGQKSFFDDVILLKIFNNINNNTNEYVQKFKKQFGIESYLLRELLTPESFIKGNEVEKNDDSEHSAEQMENFLKNSVKKVPGLEECISEIISNFTRGGIPNIPMKENFLNKGKENITIKEKYEKVLVQAILNGQITDEDYFRCMETMHALLEVNKVKLPEQEMFKTIKTLIGENDVGENDIEEIKGNINEIGGE